MTCNKLPDFGDEQVNVDKRLAVFHTKSLREPVVAAPRWIEENAMDCLVWVLNQLNNSKHMIRKSEQFYERELDDFVNEDIKLNKTVEDELEKVRKANVSRIEIDPTPVSLEQTIETVGTSGVKCRK